MNYSGQSQKAEPKEKIRYVPIYTKSEKEDESRQGNRCNNPQCMRAGRCICGMANMGSMNGMYQPIDNPIGPNPIGAPIGPNFVPNISPGVGPGIGPGIGPAAGVPIDPLRKFDYDAVNDDFTPPFRRSYYDDYSAYVLHPGIYPTYTRGPPGRFRKTGTLVAQGVASNDKYKFMNMFGREKYPGREYEYYSTSTNVENRIKFYIETKGKEIYDGDMVHIPELEGYVFRYKEDQDLSPKYDPYIV